MKTLIASTVVVSDGQKSNLVNLVADATRKATGNAVEELMATGALNGGNCQRVLAQGDKIVLAITLAVKAKIAELAENIVGCLKRLFADETITLAPTDGKETLAEASDLFGTNIDGDFSSWGCNVYGKATTETRVEIYKMFQNGTFSDIFGGFGENLDRLCLTQSQIKGFVRDHRDKLRTGGCATFFLFKVGEEYFVASVGVYSDVDLYVHVRRFSRDCVWYAERRHRVVVPQQALKA